MATICNLNLNLSLVVPGVQPKSVTWPSRALSLSRGGNGLASVMVTRAIDTNEFLGDFGARDPFPAELESSFGEKVLGYGNTEHRILIPNISALSLSQQDCAPISHSQPPISQDDAQALVRKHIWSCYFLELPVLSSCLQWFDMQNFDLQIEVVGWRLVNEEGGLKLQCLWKLRGFKCGVELINRISKVAEAAGHFPNIYLEQPNQVRAELWTASIGGLSMNDFIVAAKIDEIKISDLAPRKRVWA
ncbi:unnamed protein product [Sphenostylis stenocarpa]|uniref:4a-hydroxytetrahydrobiopterin dehydratase n=1 Tax=Sphenostylis stenocarpa TaxID=92480 RepID=A0AA86TH59_9FABA|nr:unnamed protein product [Sphenostylis stenocarpa]